VQEFYDWYLPLTSVQRVGPTWYELLTRRSEILTPQLRRALQADSAAQVGAPGESVGLDFDPFLFSQDPCERYEVGGATRKGTRYWVDVYEVCAGKRSAHPHVVAEVAPSRGGWVFVNLHYGRSNLLRILDDLKRQRARHQSNSTH
jgi:hypothetical protein